MSDYLSRAVERETAAIPHVRPALPSIFDPLKAAATSPTPETESRIEGEPSRNAHQDARTESSFLHEPLAAINALWTEAAAAPTPPETAAVMAEKPSSVFLGTPVATSPTESDFSPQKPSRVAAVEPPVVRPIAEAPLRPPDVATAEPVVRGAPASLASEPRARAPAIVEQATAPTARSAHGSTVPTSETPPAVATPKHVVAPARTTVSRVSPAPSSFEPARNSRAARNDSSSPRAIHITIGRIEVRAVHPPPEPVPRRSAPASPKISLEQYLKDRNGGRR
jgi:hypothetical protein